MSRFRRRNAESGAAATPEVSARPRIVDVSLPTFRERLDWARRTILPPGRTEPFSAGEMAHMIGHGITFDSGPVAPEHRAGYSLSKTYIADMLSGVKNNPTLDVMRTLGAFFHTGTAFFADDDGEYAKRIVMQVNYVTAIRNGNLHMLGARGGPPSPEALADLGGQVMDWLRENVGEMADAETPDDRTAPDEASTS